MQVIYNIQYACGISYIGEIGRNLDTRVKEHKASLKREDPDISKLTEHSINMGHRFKFEETKVIGKEANWRQRKIREASEILKGGENIISTPSFAIYAIWSPLIKKHEFSRSGRILMHMPCYVDLLALGKKLDK
jgi:hypothetical protein